MKTKYFVLAIAPALVLTMATSADARFGGEGRDNGERRGEMHQKLKNVEHSAEKLSNGVQVTITADNPDMVTKIQAHAGERAEREHENVNILVANLSNGVIITSTSDDPEQVAKMHERVDNLGQERPGKRAERRHFRENTEKTVTNLDNGVQVTLTSNDADIVGKLQAKEPHTPKNDEISVRKTNLSNGVQITVTTTNPDLVERIQNRAEKGGRAVGHGHGRQGMMNQ